MPRVCLLVFFVVVVVKMLIPSPMPGDSDIVGWGLSPGICIFKLLRTLVFASGVWTWFKNLVLIKERKRHRVMTSPFCLAKAHLLGDWSWVTDTRNDQAFQGRSHFLTGVWPDLQAYLAGSHHTVIQQGNPYSCKKYSCIEWNMHSVPALQCGTLQLLVWAVEWV